MNKPYSQRVAEVVQAEAVRRKVNSQSELARLTGLSQPTIRRYFYSCEREPTIDALTLVARALGTTASELMRRAEAAGPILAEPLPTPVVRRVTARNIRSTERLPRTAE